MQNMPPSPSQSTRGIALKSWMRALEYTKIGKETGPVTLASQLNGLADIYADRPALINEDEHLSYRDLAARANRYARWAMMHGLAKGDVVCLLMHNCPDYAAIWLGITRTGCAVALVNTNLVGEALLQSLEAAGATHLFVDDVLHAVVTTLANRLLPLGLQIWVAGKPTPGPWPCLEPEIANLDDARLDEAECPSPAPTDRALLIYTSGTTGLPKAANVTHGRVLEWSLWFAGMMDAQPTDRLYNCLPMYHSTGGIIAIGAMLVKGGSVLIRRRFSASRFWNDITDANCTIFQYIGELGRYLAHNPPHSKERQHNLRLACGNGLQADVWTDFQSRFWIPRILEFYAATEGIISLYNCEGKLGAIGRIPPFLAHRFPVALIKCGVETLAPARDAAGWCIACGVDEPGEAIGRLPSTTDSPTRGFDGYTDAAASEQKILQNVFVKGDQWFRTGDLLRKDAAGFFYFVDRIGDTFRWRGENVSTTQVAAVLRTCPGVTNAIVYGVTVEGNEGRAGMAAITTGEHFEFADLSAHLAASLPAYAQPVFIRCSEHLEMTGTFKLTKGTLTAEGYANSTDPVWFNDRAAGCFVSLDATLLQAISTGNRRI